MGSRHDGRWSSGRALIVCFAAVAAVFTLGTVAQQLYTEQIRASAVEITGNSSPSISAMSSMRVALRQLEVAVTDEVETCEASHCAEASSAQTLQRSLGDLWRSYRRLPTFPNEEELWPAVDAALARVEEQVVHTLAAAHDGRPVQARLLLDGAVVPACDQLDRALADISESDRAQGVAVAARIDRLARSSIRTSILLDLVSVALTVLAAALAIRVVRRYEQTLHERSEDLDQFAGRVAHDIMSPLASTSASLHVAKRYTSGPGLSALETGQRGLKRVQRLVDGLLEFARAGAPLSREASADLRETVADVVAELRPMAAELDVELHVDEPCTSTLACTTGVLTSVLSNLVRNAIAYTSKSPVRDVTIHTAALHGGREVRVEVQDTGPGIPEEVGNAIFEPFVRGGTTGVPGHGLGLATAKRFVSAHGGRIGYSSAPGSGTTFWFELPARVEQTPAT